MWNGCCVVLLCASQEIDLSTNDISGEGVRTVREILNGLAAVSSGRCRVNLDDNDDDSEDESGGSGSDISDIEDTRVSADVQSLLNSGGSVGAAAGAGTVPVVGPASAASPAGHDDTPKVLDVRGPRGALTAGRAEELCAPILR